MRNPSQLANQPNVFFCNNSFVSSTATSRCLRVGVKPRSPNRKLSSLCSSSSWIFIAEATWNCGPLWLWFFIALRKPADLLKLVAWKDLNHDELCVLLQPNNYIDICMYWYMCVYVFMYACMYVCMHACMYVCVYVCVWLYVYVCVCMCMYVYVCVCMCMYVYVCVCVCMYVYVCVCMCMYV